MRFHSVSTLHSSSFLLLALHNFTTRKAQHLQSGFRLLSLRLFLQALLAICGFRVCYSCFYRVRLDLQWREWRRWIEFPGSHWNRQSQYVKISSTAGNTSEQPAEQTLTNLQYISPPPRLKQYVLHCTGRAHWQPNAPDSLVFLSPPRLFRCFHMGEVGFRWAGLQIRSNYLTQSLGNKSEVRKKCENMESHGSK